MQHQIPSHHQIEFPYAKIRYQQQKIIDHVKNSDSKQLIIHAETGSGKTIALLTGLFSQIQNGHRLVIFVKTINQIDPILREWKVLMTHLFDQYVDQSLRNSILSEYLILPMFGKNRLCGDYVQTKARITNKTIIPCSIIGRKIGSNIRKLRKRLFQKNKRSRLLKMLNLDLLKNDSTVTQLFSYFRRKENCPFENQLTMLPHAKIIVTTYGYLDEMRMKWLLKKINCSIDNLVVILDEAHNLFMSHSVKMQRQELELFDNFLGKLVIQSRQFTEHQGRDQLSLKNFNYFLSFMRGIRIINQPDKRSKSYRSFQTENPRFLFAVKLVRERVILRLNNSNSTQIPPSIREELDVLLNTCKSILTFTNEFGSKEMLTTNKHIEMLAEQPNIIINRLKECKLLILQSGTLFPLEYFKVLYGMTNATTLDLNERNLRILKKRKNEFRVFYPIGLTSESRYRNVLIYNRYVEIILEIYNRSPTHILVLAPSYEFVEALARGLRKHGNLHVIEERAYSKSQQMIEEVIARTEKCIIIGNQAGKLSEGNEWTLGGKSVLKTIIYTGLRTDAMFEEYEVKFRRLNKIFLNKEITSLFLFEVPLLIRIKQAFGRIIRSEKDRGAFIILDDRVNSLLQRQLLLSRYTKKRDLIEDYSEFINGGSSIPMVER